MNINLMITDQMVHKIANDYQSLDKDENKRLSKAFTVLCVKATLGIDEEEAMEYILDGGGDYGIDALVVSNIINDGFNVKIFQTKYKRILKQDGSYYDGEANFPSNDVQKIINVVKNIFNPSICIQANNDIVAKVEEIRSLMLNEGALPTVDIILCNNGKWLDELGQSYIDAAKFDEEYVRFEHINHDKILDLSKGRTKVDDSIQFSGKTLVEDFDYKRVFIGKVNIAEFYRIFAKHGDKLLEKNIRKFLGTKGNQVNAQIQKTILDTSANRDFFFLNNGITIVVSDIAFNALQDENHLVKLKNINIINGGQTCKTIQETLESNPSLDVSKCFVLVRIYKIDEEDDTVANNITIATNSQTVVDLRDLKSNDDIQKRLSESVRLLGVKDGIPLFEYQPKKDSTTPKSHYLPISIAVAAEAIFSTWHHKPHNARFHKDRLFGYFYSEIFNDSLNGAQLVLAVLIWRYVENRRKRDEELKNKYYFINYASNILCMIIGNLFLKSVSMTLDKITHKNFDEMHKKIEAEIEHLYAKAVDIVQDALLKLGIDTTAEPLHRLSATFRRADLTEQVLTILSNN
jgi:hypothetical protein